MKTGHGWSSVCGRREQPELAEKRKDVFLHARQGDSERWEVGWVDICVDLV